MNPLLIEPTDVLFFRDAVPMSAGQGKGAGCRLPFPSTLHEAFRASLLRVSGETATEKTANGARDLTVRSPREIRRGNSAPITAQRLQHGRGQIASKAFQSLRTVGPLPFLAPDHDGRPVVWKERRFGRETGVQVSYASLLLPVPADATFQLQERTEQTTERGERKWFERVALRRLQLWRDPTVPVRQTIQQPSDYQPFCVPVATTPPDKHGRLSGWWTTGQYRAYLELLGDCRAREDNNGDFFRPLPATDLWSAEHRVGVEIDPGSFAAEHGQLYAGSYLRADRHTRFVAWAEIADPAKARNGEAAAREREREQLAKLDWLLLGGEFRIARLWHQSESGRPLPDGLGELRRPPTPPAGEGPCLLKWVLVTPAIFAHGSLPGWCADTKQDHAGGSFPAGRVCLDLPGRAQLISLCLGKPRAVSGFDVVEGRAKPTMLAVPEGGVYYFLCENRDTAAALAQKLHWQPRSDFYGEKGCGYGLVSFDVQMHPTAPDVRALAKELFNR